MVSSGLPRVHGDHAGPQPGPLARLPSRPLSPHLSQTVPGDTAGPWPGVGGDQGAPSWKPTCRPACWEGPLPAAPRPRRFLEAVTEGILFLVSTMLHEADTVLQHGTPGRTRAGSWGCGERRGPGAGPVGRPSAPRRGRPGGHDAAGAELRRGQGCRGRQAAGSHALQRPQQAWKACQESLRGRRSGVRKRGQSGHPEPGRKRPPEGGEEGEDSRLGKALLGTRNQEGPDGWVPGTGRSWP